MIFQLLLASPLVALLWLAAIITSLTVHEFGHAAMATWRGDGTAAWSGRLTLNPMAHLDPWGFLLMLLVGFGWAKPVPFDPRRLRHPLRDGALIGLAGPLSNGLLLLLIAVFVRLVGVLSPEFDSSALGIFLIFLAFSNAGLMIFNLLPVPPLDGSHVLNSFLTSPGGMRVRVMWESLGPQLLLALVAISLFTPFSPFGFIGSLAERVVALVFGVDVALFS
jgi:Zn-dependent protease